MGDAHHAHHHDGDDGAAAAAAAAWIEDREPFPEGLTTEIVVLLAVCLPVVAAAVVLTVTRRTFRLSQVLSLVMAAALVAVGTASWAATYVETRRVLHARVETLMVRAADLASTRIQHELKSGAVMLNLLAAQVAIGRVQITNDYPRGQIDLAAMYKSLDVPSSVQTFFYAGFVRDGGGQAQLGAWDIAGDSLMHGGHNHGNVSQDATGFLVGVRAATPINASITSPTRVDDLVVYAQFSDHAPVPSFVACPAQNRVHTANASMICDAYVCGTSFVSDFDCQATCAVREAADVADVPFAVRRYPDAASWYCRNAPDASPMTITVFDASFTWQAGGRFTAASQQAGSLPYPPTHQSPAFDPRTRPWWTNAHIPEVSQPYVYSDGTGIGISIAVGLYDPIDNFVGCAGVDFSLASLQAVMQALRPTERSVIHLATVGGALVGTTLTHDELAEDIGGHGHDHSHHGEISGSDEIVRDVLAIANPHSLIRFAFHAIAARYNNSLAAAWRYRALLHAGGRVLTSVPLGVDNAPYILVVDAPYADIMGAADEGSFRSLLITMFTSLAASVFVFVAVHQLLKPLRRLADEMADVACMRLETPVVASRVVEVRGMEESFRILVLKLMEYREYLPQSVLMDGAEDDGSDDDDDMADNPTSDDGSSSCASRGGEGKAAGGPKNTSFKASDHSSMEGIAITFPPDGARSHASNTSGGSHSPSLKKCRVRGTPDESAVKFALELRSKQVSLLVVNAGGFHAYAQSAAPDAVVAAHTAYVHAVAEAAKVRRGVVEGFSGDRVSVGFNSVGSLSGHKTACVACALEVVRRVRANAAQIPFLVNTACAGGRAQTGNMGAVGLKKHTVLGNAASAVRAFERLGRHWGLDVVAGWTLLQGTAEGFESRYLHPVSVGGVVQVVREVMHERVMADEEWMYQLQAAAAGSCVTTSNKACVLYFEGQTERALEVIREDSGCMYTKLLEAWFTAAPQPPPPLRCGMEEVRSEAAAYVVCAPPAALPDPRTRTG